MTTLDFVRVARAVTGHGPTGEYARRFRPAVSYVDTFCSCSPVFQTRNHILFECPHYVRDEKFTLGQGFTIPVLGNFIKANKAAFDFWDAG